LRTVVHICLDIASAEAELPTVFGGDAGQDAASSLGSNATRQGTDRAVPKILLFGGDVADDEIEKVTGLVKEKSPNAVIIKISKLDVFKAGGLGPNPDVIAKVYRKKLSKEL
jgi:hypothetical protein